MGKIKWILASVGALAVAFATQFVAGIIYSVGLMISMMPRISSLARSGLSVEDYDFQMEIIVSEVEQQISEDMLLVSCIAALANLLVFGLWYYFYTKKHPRIAIRSALTASNVGILLILGVGLQFFVSGALNIVLNLPALENISSQYMELLESVTGGSIVFSLLLTVVIAPISEELIFRGVILKFGNRCMPFFAANIMQALFFGIYHMNIVQGVYAFVIGLALGYVMIKFKTILIPILLHAAINASSFLIEPINEVFKRNLSEDGLEYIFLGVGLLISTIVIYFIWRKPDLQYQRYENQSDEVYQNTNQDNWQNREL